MPTVTIAYEFAKDSVKIGEMVIVLDTEGTPLDEVKVTNVQAIERNDRKPLPEQLERLTDDTIVCRCERVTAGEIRALIRQGCRDMNEVKAVTRAGMGACGGKTCTALIKRIFREEGIPIEKVAEEVKRPLFIEVPLGTFAGTASAGAASAGAAFAETEEER
jgi:bacterioferritin-associated ferredoxin